MRVFCRDGSSSERVQVDFPIGHRRRRAAGMPVLLKRFESAVDAQFAPKRAAALEALLARSQQLDALPVKRVAGGDSDERAGRLSGARLELRGC